MTADSQGRAWDGRAFARGAGWVLLLAGVVAGVVGVLAHSVLLMIVMTVAPLLSLFLNREEMDVRQALIRAAKRYPILWILWWLNLPGMPVHDFLWGP